MTASWASRNTTSSTLFTPRAKRGQPVPDDLRGERAVRVGEVPGVDLRAPVQQQRGDDQEDHAQHEPRRAGVRPGEPGRPALPLGVVAQPDHREGDQPGQDQHREQVLQEPQRERMPDPGDREPAGEQVPVGLDDREDQDDEAPERDEVSQRPGPSTSAASAGRTPPRPGPRRRVPRASGPPRSAPARAARPGRAGPATTAGAPAMASRGHGHQQANDDSQGHEGPPPAASAASVRRRLPPVLARLTACQISRAGTSDRQPS